MSFPSDVAEQALLDSGRQCCLCHKFCGPKIELHHIGQKSEGGDDTYENCMPLCFDCHSEVKANNPKHPKGRKYTESELKAHRDRWYAIVRGRLGAPKEQNVPTVMVFNSRKSYNDAVIHAIEANPRILRAIVIGPHFLHPEWIMQRRMSRELRKSLSIALRNYLQSSKGLKNRDIRLILRNSRRYVAYLSQLINQSEIPVFTAKVISNLHNIFNDPNISSFISFCCLDTGYYHGVVITEDFCFVSNRRSHESQIDGGYVLRDSEYIKQELDHFDNIFDANFRGVAEEIKLAEAFISSLENSIRGDSIPGE